MRRAPSPGRRASRDVVFANNTNDNDNNNTSNSTTTNNNDKT